MNLHAHTFVVCLLPWCGMSVRQEYISLTRLTRHDTTTLGFLGEAAGSMSPSDADECQTTPVWRLVGQTATVDRGNMLSDLAAAASAAALPTVCLSNAPCMQTCAAVAPVTISCGSCALSLSAEAVKAVVHAFNFESPGLLQFSADRCQRWSSSTTIVRTERCRTSSHRHPAM